MIEKKPDETPHDGGWFTSEGCGLLQIEEEDTQPGTVSDSYRKHLRDKYGPKPTPPNTPPPSGPKPE
jgi:hypothetical protein